MSDSLSRRDWIKVVGAAGAGSILVPGMTTHVHAQGTPILPLTSTSEVFIPGRGQEFMKFSFDFPEPSVEVGGIRLGFLVFSRENAYGLDRERMTVEGTADELTLTASGLVWAGGQERAQGTLVARIRKRGGGAVECDITADMAQPIKAVTMILRGVPRGHISTAGNNLFDPRDNEILIGYPFGAGDLFGGNTAGSMTTPLATIQQGDDAFFYISSLDDHVRAKRFYFQPGPNGYRVEAVHEVEGWLDRTRVEVPTWRFGRTSTLDAATDLHYAHLERAYGLPAWEARDDVPAWLRDVALVMTLHGEHYTGYVFNDFARMAEILRWVATKIPGQRVLVFVSAWDGRYYWNYPKYEASPRMGGETGFREFVQEAQHLGFHVMPMFGANVANRRQPLFERVADAATYKIDGDRFDTNWVDWDNDRHQEGWLSYMNLGVDSWRNLLTERIADTIDRYGVDAYFLDIIGGWVNNPQADMNEGARRMVADLRGRYPNVMVCGEMVYDALLGFIPLYHASNSRAARKYARFFSHLSHPAPGRGSSGVHESGFGRWDEATLSLRDDTIPTLNVVDDTFTAYRQQMAAVIAKAKARAGIP
jgi:Domain of unknown function (DUF6259)